MTSQCYFSCSWMHNHSREFIWSICEADPWTRDERGIACGKEPVPVPPPPAWEPPAGM
jgi:hypothetical protein